MTWIKKLVTNNAGPNSDALPSGTVAPDTTVGIARRPLPGDAVFLHEHVASVYALVDLYEVICNEFSGVFPVGVLNRTFERIANAISALHLYGILSPQDVAAVYNRIVDAHRVRGEDRERCEEVEEEDRLYPKQPDDKLRRLKL